MKLANRILKVIETTGPREPALLQRILRASADEYQRAIGYLVLKGQIIFRGMTNGRKIHLNGRRSAGFGTIQLAATIGILGILAAIVFMVKAYIDGVDKRGFERGVAATTAKWEERERKQQQGYQAEIERLRAEKDAAVAGLMGKLAESDARYAREVRNAKAENERLRADVRAGRIVFNDPGARTAAPGKAGGGEGAADPGAVGGGDAAARTRLSSEAAGFLWAEAERANEVVLQLHAAQREVMAYYHLAQECR